MKQGQIEINACGLACPIPVIRAKQTLENMQAGTLVVRVDEQVAVENIKRLVSYLSLREECERIGDEWRITIRKGIPTGGAA